VQTLTRTFATNEIESLVRQLPAGVDVEFECLSYGLRELRGEVSFVEGYDGESRIVVEASGVQQSAPIGSVQSIRCDVSRSPELARLVCAGLPLSTSIELETQSGLLHGSLSEADITAELVCIDLRGAARAVPADEVVAIRVACA
jgi:hypothetical protein